MINIYIGISKNQVFSYEEILKLKEGLNSKNVLISNKTIENNTELWDEVIYADKSFNNQSNSGISAFYNITQKIKQYKQVILSLKKYKQEKKVTLYFTYIEDILTNYLLFSTRRRYDLLSFNKILRISRCFLFLYNSSIPIGLQYAKK